MVPRGPCSAAHASSTQNFRPLARPYTSPYACRDVVVRLGCHNFQRGRLGKWPFFRAFWRPGSPRSGCNSQRPGLQLAIFSLLLRLAQGKESKCSGVPSYGSTDPTHEDATLTASVPKASPRHAITWGMWAGHSCPVTPGVRLDTTQGRRFATTRSLFWPRWVSPGLCPPGPYRFRAGHGMNAGIKPAGSVSGLGRVSCPGNQFLKSGSKQNGRRIRTDQVEWRI